VLGPLSKQIKFSSSGFSELGKTDTAYVFVNSIDYGLALVAYDWSEGGSEDEFIELVSHNLNTGSIDKIRYIYLGLENMPLEYARLRHSEGQHLIYSYSKADDVLLEFGLFYPVFT